MCAAPPRRRYRPPQGLLTDHLDLQVLGARYPRHLIEQVLAQTGKSQKRSRALPAHVMMCFSIAQGLHPQKGSDALMRELAGTLRTTGSWSKEWKVPTTSAIAQARARLGLEPLAELFERACLPMAGLATPGGFCGPLRMVSMDGTALDVAETGANADHFGYAGNDADRSAFPKARVVTLNEVGTHAAIGAAIGPWPAGERGGSPTSVELPPITPLADGSYTSLLFAPRVRRKTKDALIAAARAGAHIDPSKARLVRAVDYTVPDANPEGELITVVTSALDPRALPAARIAQAYGQRWEHETALGEIKRYLRGAGVVLSSQSPSMVRAQIWGLLLAHYAIRALMCEAADHLEADPDRMSFTHALQVIRPASRGGAVFSP